VRIAVIQRIVGLLLMVFSLTMLPPMVVSLFSDDGQASAFIEGLVLILGTGVALWLPVRRVRRELLLRDGFVVVVLFWVALGVTGSVPLLLADQPMLSLTDAVFESVSGLTTTGATVITGLDELPRSLLFYRQFLQWLGGMGIIVLAVAILPMLGIGGMQLYRAETPGPVKDNKLTPRIAETAKALWYIYLGLTIACAVAYWIAGMDGFDAIAHSFSTVSIGGFSTHDTSIDFFEDPEVEAVAVVFMVISGMNFALHFTALRGRRPGIYLADAEFRAYVLILAVLAVIISGYLYATGTYTNLATAVREGVFQTVSVSTTTGFTTSGYHQWPGFVPVLLLFASFVGGCAGSTGGGLKVVRVLLLIKQGLREILRLVHPRALVPIKIGNQNMPQRVIDAVWGFFAAYVATFALMLLGLMATGLDQVTAFSAVAACINNLGPGLGDVATHYGHIGDAAKWILALAMLLGRLEVFTLLVVLSPAFWRG